MLLTVMHTIFLIVECSTACFLYAMHALGHQPRPLDYLCAKFCFFCGIHCWASPWRL